MVATDRVVRAKHFLWVGVRARYEMNLVYQIVYQRSVVGVLITRFLTLTVAHRGMIDLFELDETTL